jgi:tetratricopeptide (TPR) repeat protein
MKNTPKYTLTPTAEQTFELEGSGPWDFRKRLRTAEEMQRSGQIEAACEERYRAVQLIEELLPEEEEINLEWNHPNSRAALELIHGSAIDHFLIGDFELSAALLELCLELDPEDHLEAVNLLGFDYVELGEYDLCEEILLDISEKSPMRPLLELWLAFRRSEELAAAPLQHLKSRHTALFEEFTAEEHPADDAFIKEINSERPSARAQARELWLQTEPLWALHPEFISALKAAKG